MNLYVVRALSFVAYASNNQPSGVKVFYFLILCVVINCTVANCLARCFGNVNLKTWFTVCVGPLRKDHVALIKRIHRNIIVHSGAEKLCI